MSFRGYLSGTWLPRGSEKGRKVLDNHDPFLGEGAVKVLPVRKERGHPARPLLIVGLDGKLSRRA